MDGQSDKVSYIEKKSNMIDNKKTTKPFYINKYT